MAFDFSCPDWVDRLRQGRPPIPDLDLDRPAAERAVKVFNRLHLPDVPGKPSLGEAGGEWFREIVRAAFGSRDPVTGENRVGEIFCLVPKKNSKTTNSAALGLTALLLNDRPNAEMLIVAPTKEVADTCFRQAARMVEADPPDPETGKTYLPARFHVAEHLKTITDRVNGSTLKVKAFDMRVVTGSIPALTIVDELHVLGASHHAERVLGQIRGGMITRPDSLLVFITTQSDEPPAGVFKQELDYARKVRDGGVADGNTLAILYEFPEHMQLDPDRPWADPENWPMVLPNLGRSITLDRLQRLYRQAAEKGEAELIRWASQHLNVQVGMGRHSDSWIGANFWIAQGLPDLSLEAILDTSDCVTGGIDGGGLDDLLGVGVIGRHAKTRVWQAWAKAWAMPEVLERRKSIAPRLLDFERAGDLVICDDATQDLREVAALLSQVRETGLFPEKWAIGLDPSHVGALIDELDRRDLGGALLGEVRQGGYLAPAIWGLERKLKDGTFVHAAQPLLTWCVGNAKVDQRGNKVAIDKAVSGKAKIDPLIAILNAATFMARNPIAAGASRSPWDDPAFRLSA